MPRIVGYAERLQLCLWDCYRWDGGRSNNPELPRYSAGHPTQFFSNTAADQSLCNVPCPGHAPRTPETNYIFRSVSLGLTFSDYELYQLAFRELFFDLLFGTSNYRYSYRASQFLDGAIDSDHQHDPGLGFVQSIPFSTSLAIPSGRPFHATIYLEGELGRRLKAAEENPPDGWFAEIRLYLEGHQVVHHRNDSTIVF